MFGSSAAGTSESVVAEEFIEDASLDARFCTMGAGCRGRPVVHVYQGDHNRVRIGSSVEFGDDVELFVGGNHRIDWVTTFGLREVYGLPGAFEGNPWSKGDVVIDDAVSIGRGTKIMSGVTIGEGAVIRPFSIVLHDVRPYAIIEGCPASEVGRRFDDPTIEARLATRRAEPVDDDDPMRRFATVRGRAAEVTRKVLRRLEGSTVNGVDAAAEPAANDDVLAMGTATYFAPIVHRGSGTGRVTIGSYSSIPYDGEMVLEPTHPPSTVASATSEEDRSRDIDIGSDVWIGRGAKVLAGVTIGDGAVVAAYSVVTTHVRPYAIAAGNPAREVGRRFDDETVDALLRIQWWTWPSETVRERAADLCSPDVDAFVERYG